MGRYIIAICISREFSQQEKTRSVNLQMYLLHIFLMLLVANLTIRKWCKNMKEWLKPWHMGTHLRVLSKSFLMNTNLTGLRWFSEIFASSCFGQNSLSIGMVKEKGSKVLTMYSQLSLLCVSLEERFMTMCAVLDKLTEGEFSNVIGMNSGEIKLFRRC